MRTANIAILIYFIIAICFSKTAAEPENKNLIVVECSKETGPVNKKVFGNNIIAYDPKTYEDDWHEDYCGYYDFGAGIWDPKWEKSVKEVTGLAKKAGITVLRFPGGCGTHHYDWKKAIGKKREHFLYGVDEFLTTCEEIGAEPVITVSYFTGNEQDAADLVEYLNAPSDGSNRNGGADWADERAKNGHRVPYNVQYFEIGNEVWHGDHREVKRVTAEEYAARYIKYYESMKAVDPSVSIGVLLNDNDQMWSEAVVGAIAGRADFGVLHIYPAPGISGEMFKKIPANEIFERTLFLSLPERIKVIQSAAALLKQKMGRNVPIAITEYNAGFVQEEPIPYRHTLGSALVNAELIKTFLEPGNNINFANYWQFNNSYWGMISNCFSDRPADLRNQYYKRPNYYVFEMYAERFGDILIDSSVNMPSLSVNAAKSGDGKKVYLIVVNKNMHEPVASTINFNGFIASGKGNAWTLNGPGVDATNEKNHENVKLAYKDLAFTGNTFTFMFEPHSIVAIQIEGKGSDDNDRAQGH